MKKKIIKDSRKVKDGIISLGNVVIDYPYKKFFDNCESVVKKVFGKTLYEFDTIQPIDGGKKVRVFGLKVEDSKKDSRKVKDKNEMDTIYRIDWIPHPSDATHFGPKYELPIAKKYANSHNIKVTHYDLSYGMEMEGRLEDLANFFKEVAGHKKDTIREVKRYGKKVKDSIKDFKVKDGSLNNVINKVKSQFPNIKISNWKTGKSFASFLISNIQTRNEAEKIARFVEYTVKNEKGKALEFDDITEIREYRRDNFPYEIVVRFIRPETKKDSLKTFKVNNSVVKAKDYLDAVKKVKDESKHYLDVFSCLRKANVKGNWYVKEIGHNKVRVDANGSSTFEITNAVLGHCKGVDNAFDSDDSVVFTFKDSIKDDFNSDLKELQSRDPKKLKK